MKQRAPNNKKKNVSISLLSYTYCESNQHKDTQDALITNLKPNKSQSQLPTFSNIYAMFSSDYPTGETCI